MSPRIRKYIIDGDCHVWTGSLMQAFIELQGVNSGPAHLPPMKGTAVIGILPCTVEHVDDIEYVAWGMDRNDKPSPRLGTVRARTTGIGEVPMLTSLGERFAILIPAYGWWPTLCDMVAEEYGHDRETAAITLALRAIFEVTPPATI